MASLKQQLHALALAKLEDQIVLLKEAIDSAKAAANEETKSSVGDKYETGRAMIQLELEKFSTQLHELTKTKTTLQSLDLSDHHFARAGSMVTTNHGVYFISVNAGSFSVDGKNVQTLSAGSPLGLKLIKLKKGDEFSFLNKVYTVSGVE